MDGGGDVSAVVHRDLRSARADHFDMGPIALNAFTVSCEDRGACALDQRSRSPILGRKWVSGTEDDLSATLDQCLNKVGGLGRHVQTGPNTDPFKWLLAGEPVAYRAQYRHLRIGPCDRRRSRIGEGYVGDL